MSRGIYLALIAAIFLSASVFLVWDSSRGVLCGSRRDSGRGPRCSDDGARAPGVVAGVARRRRRRGGAFLRRPLLSTVDEIARKVGAPRVHRIFVGRAHNATALQARYGWIPWRRNTLILGYPLLATLTTDQMRAVIAHELAHLTHAHGRFSGWVHRTRRMWVQLLDMLERHRSVPVHVYFLYRFYVPRLSRHAATVSRQHEVIADRLAADVAGAHVAAQALLAQRSAPTCSSRATGRASTSAWSRSPTFRIRMPPWARASGRTWKTRRV